VALRGPSGSGKSTLLHLVGALDAPTRGEVEIDGRPLSGMNDDELTLLRRRRIGFVFQFFNLLPTLTSEEDVAFPLLLDGNSMSSARERVDGMLRLVGLSERRSHRSEELSGGEMQRVAIARALVIRPLILLADEPTGNLDSKTGGEIVTLLKSAVKSYGQAALLVTHDPKVASAADRVVLLQDGRVAEELRPGRALAGGVSGDRA